MGSLGRAASGTGQGCVDADAVNEDKGSIGICNLVRRDTNEVLFLLRWFFEGDEGRVEILQEISMD